MLYTNKNNLSSPFIVYKGEWRGASVAIKLFRYGVDTEVLRTASNDGRTSYRTSSSNIGCLHNGISIDHSHGADGMLPGR